MNIQLFLYDVEHDCFIKYLGLMLDTLKKEGQEIDKRFQELEAQISTDEQRADFDAFVGDEAENFQLYNDLLLESFLIWLYSYLEKSLNDLCERFSKLNKLELRLCDISGKGINRAKIFMKKVCKFNLPEESLWESLVRLSEIRNTIVHNGGIVKNEELRKFIDEQGRKEISCSLYGKIDISPEYCTKVLESVFVYLRKLEELSPS